MVGKTISHYRILEEIGRGGMGVVYKAEDTKLKRTVALKFLPAHLSGSEQEKARFFQEAQAASALNHPNVCAIHDIQEYDSRSAAGPGDVSEGPSPGKQTFIVMEYMEGQTLLKMIRSSSEPIPIDRVISIATQIADALVAAHEKGIVHRDIKSENIMVSTKGQVKMMDFGLAKFKGSLKLTKTRSTVGTLGYMSPEQIQDGTVDHRSDQFSFGVVLFELLTGRLPFRAEHEAALLYSIVHELPDSVSKYRSDVPAELVALLQRTLEKNPENRFARTEDLQQDL
jgi:serine/threonine protein kinase